MKFGHAIPLLFSMLAHQAASHGAMTKPLSRNWLAYPSNGVNTGNNPKADWNWMALPENEDPVGSGNVVSACGRTQGNIIAEKFDYDHPLDSNGAALAWYSRAIYAPGQQMEVEVVLTAHHEGFFEFSICGNTGAPTKACFDNYPLEFVYDEFYGAPKDLSHPTRAYIPPESYSAYRYQNGGKHHKYVMKLPNSLPSGNVLLQWRYTTGNTCQVESGYLSYYNSIQNWPSSRYGNLGNCQNPLPEARTNFQTVPERFWNCAEVTIGSGPVSTPTPVAQPTPAPVSTPRPVAQPTPAPVSTPSGGGVCDCSDGSYSVKAANNCDGYVTCNHGSNFGYQACASGLKYDENKRVCDWPDNVQCPSSCQARRKRNLRAGNAEEHHADAFPAEVA